jgi:hypothetical protein
MQHNLNGIIATHFQKLGLVTQYLHEVYPDDSFLKDLGMFENSLERMRARHIPEERIAVLGQESEQERLEWGRQCFIAGPSEEKDVKTAKDKDKVENPSRKKKMLLKETTSSEAERLRAR